MLRTLLVLAFTALASGAVAQTPWRGATDGPVIALDALYSRLGGVVVTDDQGNLLGEGRVDAYLALLSTRVPVSTQLSVVSSLPIGVPAVRFGDFPAGDAAESTSLDIGNVYAGLVATPLAGGEVEVGVWLPTATAADIFGPDISAVGFATDRANFESYKTRVVSARLALRGETALSPVLAIRGEVAPVLSYFTGDLPTDVSGEELDVPRTNAALTTALFADVRLGAVSLTAGALGRYEPEGGTERYLDEVFASGLAMVTYQGSSLRPALGVRLPLAGTSSSDVVIQVGLGVPLR